MLYIDRIDKVGNKVYLYDTEMKYMYTVTPKLKKIETCINYTKNSTEDIGYCDDITKIPTTSLLLYNSTDAIALVQVQGGNRILCVYVYGFYYEIALAGGQLIVNDDAVVRLRSGVSNIEFRYMYQYRGCAYYGITLVDKRTLDVHQFKFDSKGNIYYNNERLSQGVPMTKTKFRRVTLLA